MPDQPIGDNQPIRIWNWHAIGDPISGDTRLTRYMKLSTFLLLLENRLFIPSLRLLQSSDNLESRIPEKLLRSRYGKKMRAIVEPHEKILLEKAVGPKACKAEGEEHNVLTLAFLSRRWLEELAIRRCVWCWNRSTAQLYALWRLYGERGIAVISTVNRIRQALEKGGVSQGIVAPLQYAPLDMPQTPEQADTLLKIEEEQYLCRPYLFKDYGYRIEEEVRFVLYSNPAATSNLKGIVIHVDAKTLILDFKYSPELPKAERDCIDRLVRAWKRSELASIEEEHGEEAEPAFLDPFSTEVDDLYGMFNDLR